MLPVTVVLARTPAPGHEADLVQWAEGIAEVAQTYDGHLEAQVIRASASPSADVIIAFTFASAEQLTAWEKSEERASWLKRLDGIVVGAAESHTVSGFESIFSKSSQAVSRPPARWKTAVVIALALYPMSMILAWVLGPLTGSWPIPFRSLITTICVVPYMAWVGVPFLTRWLSPWLKRG